MKNYKAMKTAKSWSVKKTKVLTKLLFLKSPMMTEK